jgi:membrane associated rhomboid family serine protease
MVWAREPGPVAVHFAYYAMIPLRDNNPTSSFPIVTVALILINVLVFVFQPPNLKSYYEMIPADVVSGQVHVGVLHVSDSGDTFQPTSPEVAERVAEDSQTDMPVLPTIEPTWLTIFTSMFLHANILHIAGNMLFLWIFGNNVEDALGKLRYLIFYLGCGFVAAVAQIAVGPDSYIPTLGASGAIAGVLGAYIVMFPGARVLTIITALFIWFLREISAFWVIGIWIALEVAEGYYGLDGPQTGGVAHFAHIGGFVAGVAAVLAMGGRKLGQRQRQLPKYPRRGY